MNPVLPPLNPRKETSMKTVVHTCKSGNGSSTVLAQQEIPPHAEPLSEEWKTLVTAAVGLAMRAHDGWTEIRVVVSREK